MPRVKSVLLRSIRPSRQAAQTSAAINNVLLGSKKNIGPALGRPRPSVGVRVKKMPTRRNRNLKIKKLLAQPNQGGCCQKKKNGVILRRMTVHSKAYYPGRRRKIY